MLTQHLMLAALLGFFFTGGQGGRMLPQWVVEYSGDEETLQRQLSDCRIEYLFDNFYQVDAPETHTTERIETLHQHLHSHSELSWVERQEEQEKDLSFPVDQHTSYIPYQVTVKPNDTRWPDQWYLNGTAGEVDMNVLEAWELGVSGEGVLVAVVDAGINNNTELVDKISKSRMIQNDSIPAESHGTWVSGVIGAERNNGICGTGIAPGVKLLDAKIFPSTSGMSSTPRDEALGLQADVDKVHIYHNSWTAVSTGTMVVRPSPLVVAAVRKGIREGRRGKGSIYVWSAGNGGDYDGCAYDGYLNTPLAIVVTGVNRNLTRLGTGEQCSAVMVTAFSSDVTIEEKNPIITPTGDAEGCTDTFGRSSAASPMVSGAIALALEANRDLTYRDVMHILTITSNSGVFEHSPHNDFVTNAAGLPVSPSFGFGLLDIGAVVKKALEWRLNLVQPVSSCSFTVVEPSDGLTLGYNTSAFHVIAKDCDVAKLEHVEVEFNGNYTFRGELKLSLMSPGGTTAVILKGRPMDFFQNELHVKSTAVTFWNEEPKGSWNFTLENLGDATNKGILRELKLTLYGQVAPSSTTVPPPLTSPTPTTETQTTPILKTSTTPPTTTFSTLPTSSTPTSETQATTTPKTSIAAPTTTFARLPTSATSTTETQSTPTLNTSTTSTPAVTESTTGKVIKPWMIVTIVLASIIGVAIIAGLIRHLYSNRRTSKTHDLNSVPELLNIDSLDVKLPQNCGHITGKTIHVRIYADPVADKAV